MKKRLQAAVLVTLVGTILGGVPSIYDAALFLSQARTFEQVRIGMPEEEVSTILMNAHVRCGISLHREHVCFFSDFWRDYEITADPDTRMISSLVYFPRKRLSILQRIIGKA